MRDSKVNRHVAGVRCLAIWTLALAASSAIEAVRAREPAYDIAIVNGRVMDPESGLDAILNVAIKGGKVVKITRKPVAAKRIINASGLVVAPGFVDLHAHDHDMMTHRLHARDGVTTALELEFGTYPVKQWYERRRGTSPINFGVSASHGMARAVAKGAVEANVLSGETHVDMALAASNLQWTGEPTSASEREAMAAMLQQQLDDGAVGIGYHLANTPGADESELRYFFSLSAANKTVNFIHYRSFEYVTPFEGAREVVETARATGASAHAVHINSSALQATSAVLALFDEARKSGVDVSTEVYPYTGAASSLSDPRLAAMKDLGIEFGDLELVATGERLTEESFKRYRTTTPDGMLIAHFMRQSDVDQAVEYPGTIIASDGGAFSEVEGHPRGAGTFARIFARYVRERKTLSLMEAIRRVSYLPARRLERIAPSMKWRGRLKRGSFADVTIFDPATIKDRATYAEPDLPSAGIVYVLVNGVPVVDAGTFVDANKPGQPVYGQVTR